MSILFSIAVILVVWTGACAFFGPQLVPSFWLTMVCLGKLVLTQEFWQHLSITVFRSMAALIMTVGLALCTGILAGRIRRIMDMISPLVACLQAMPPILWITLVMVWAGTGNLVPVLVVMASLFPPLFLSVAGACDHLDQRLFDLARLYRVRKIPILWHVILPGIFPHFLAGLSFALGSSLKVAAVAEFLGADQGIGARIYWAYRMMDMESLFSWALVLVGLGVAIDFMLIRPLRQIVRGMEGDYADS